MMRKTATGYRLTYEKHDTALWTDLNRGFVNLMCGLWAPLAVFPVSISGAKRWRLTLNLAEIAHNFLQEAVLCTDGEAFFAGGVMGCSMVEALLMLACVRDRDIVLGTRAWKAFAKKERRRGQTFSQLIPWIDFGNLIAIGKELGWFSPDRQKTERLLATYADSTDVDEVLAENPGIQVSPLEAITRIHELRNLLHPGRCLRENIKIEKKMAKLTMGLVYISLMGVLDFYQGDPADYIDLEIPPAFRNQLKWTEEVEAPPRELPSAAAEH